MVSRERSETRESSNNKFLPSLVRCNKRKRVRGSRNTYHRANSSSFEQHTLDDAWRRASPDQRKTIEFHVRRQTDSRRRHPTKRRRRRRKPRFLAGDERDFFFFLFSPSPKYRVQIDPSPIDLIGEEKPLVRVSK